MTNFTIKPLTTSIDIKTLRQLLGSWHMAGLSDTQAKKMLYLYLGEPAWMDLGKTYPCNNFCNIANSLNFHSKSEFLEVILRCKGFGHIWKKQEEGHTHSNLLAIYTPIWHVEKEEEMDSPGVDSPSVDSPGVDSPGVDSPSVDSPSVDSPGVVRYNSLYDIYNKKKNNRKKKVSKYVSALRPENFSDSGQHINSNLPSTTSQQQQVVTAAAQQLIRHIATDPDAYANVVKPINEMTIRLMPELTIDPSAACPATDATVRFINQHLYPYILQHGERLMGINSLIGQSCWLANLIKKEFMMQKISTAVNETRRYLAQHPQEKMRANRSENGLEYQDPDTGQRFYDTLMPDGTRKQHRIPPGAPPRTQPDTVWSKYQKAWVKEVKG